MGSIKKLIEKNIHDVYVRSLEIGSSIEEDTLNGFFMNVNDQIDMVCQQLVTDKNIQAGYNAIGFSQGGQFLRAIAQRCPTPPMLNLISVGGQHQGVFGLPHCPEHSTICEYVRRVLDKEAYVSNLLWKSSSDYCQWHAANTEKKHILNQENVEEFGKLANLSGSCFQRSIGEDPLQAVLPIKHTRKAIPPTPAEVESYSCEIQDRLVQAEYWHDPLNEAEYRAKSVFLADINQEQSVNQTYRTNLMKLKNMVLVKFLQDTMVEPKESEWFGYYQPGQDKKLYTLFDSPLYTQDKLGLKSLNATGRLHFLTSDTDHLQFTEQWFIDNILNKFLK